MTEAQDPSNHSELRSSPLVGGVADAHCHLANLPDPDAAVEEAARSGTGPILAVSMTPEEGRKVLALRSRFPGRVIAGVGLHPSRVPELADEEIAAELALVAERADGGSGEGADFIGEIGLDYKDARDAEEQRRQREVLERLLEIAESTRLPVNLHTRRADSDLLSMAQEFALRTDIPVVIHWFTHSKKLAWKCADAGIFISAGPSIEIDPAQMDVARSIAGDFLLVETDSPVEYAGKPAQPSWTHRIASSLAAARGVDEGELRETLGRNLERYLRPVRKERRSGQSTT